MSDLSPNHSKVIKDVPKENTSASIFESLKVIEENVINPKKLDKALDFLEYTQILSATNKTVILYTKHQRF